MENQNVYSRKQLISNANCIMIHSGNVLYSLLHTSEEICLSFCGTIRKWIEDETASKLNQCYPDCLCISNKAESDNINETRDELKITLKLFLEEINPSVVKEAIMTVINELDCKKLDSVLLSLPPTSQCPKETFRSIKYENIKEVWLMLEGLVESGYVMSLGVCDFDFASLQDLYQGSNVKPVTNQINLENCCTPPDDLMAYSAEHSINLLTHNDPTDILPQELLQNVLPDNDSKKVWNATYLARYSSVVKYREIVKSKGYFLCMKASSGNK